MQHQLIKAVRMHARGDLERAKTNILVYMHNPAGIGEHSDVVEAIQAELDKMAIATDRLDMIEEVEYEVHYDESADDDWLDSLDNVKDDE
jgi:hypothetical protein|tara:strand:+ start:2389 stop:2658 length:270 start_codon:yes stop_codon:yes gene_type:complete